MIDEADARSALERRAAVLGFGDPLTETVPGGIGLRRVRSGWLGWAGRTDAQPGTAASIRLEMRDADNTPYRWPGHVLRWPDWPIGQIADRIDAAMDTDRFPPYVQAMLEISGWFPGRAVPDHYIDDYDAHLATLAPYSEEGDLPPVVHAAARVALREFGALQIPPSSRGGGLRVVPDPGYVPDSGHRRDGEEAADLSDLYEQRFCIVAHHTDTEILMAEEGWCIASGLDTCRAGGTFDEMITFMLTHPVPFPSLDVTEDAARHRAGR